MPKLMTSIALFDIKNAFDLRCPLLAAVFNNNIACFSSFLIMLPSRYIIASSYLASSSLFLICFFKKDILLFSFSFSNIFFLCLSICATILCLLCTIAKQLLYYGFHNTIVA